MSEGHEHHSRLRELDEAHQDHPVPAPDGSWATVVTPDPDGNEVVGVDDEVYDRDDGFSGQGIA